MIKISFNDEKRILILTYIGKIEPSDYIMTYEKVVPWSSEMMQAGGYGVLSDLREITEITPEAAVHFKGLLSQYVSSGSTLLVSVFVFKDSNLPGLKNIRDSLMEILKSPSLYFTDYDKAFNYLVDRIEAIVEKK